MIEANKGEFFPITVSLLDEGTGQLATGRAVNYDVRTMDDQPLTPPVSGTLTESIVEQGIYRAEISLADAGSYICYATCSGFITGTEEVLISDIDVYEMYRANSPHNVSVIDVPRTTVSGATTASQTARKVPFGKTDYVISITKRDSDLDWSNPVSSGISYAHYRSLEDETPYMMGAAF